jgi:hypothetical protein
MDGKISNLDIFKSPAPPFSKVGIENCHVLCLYAGVGDAFIINHLFRI